MGSRVFPPVDPHGGVRVLIAPGVGYNYIDGFFFTFLGACPVGTVGRSQLTVCGATAATVANRTPGVGLGSCRPLHPGDPRWWAPAVAVLFVFVFTFLVLILVVWLWWWFQFHGCLSTVRPPRRHPWWSFAPGVGYAGRLYRLHVPVVQVASDRFWIHGGVRAVRTLVVGSDHLVMFVFTVLTLFVLILTVTFWLRARFVARMVPRRRLHPHALRDMLLATVDAEQRPTPHPLLPVGVDYSTWSCSSSYIGPPLAIRARPRAWDGRFLTRPKSQACDRENSILEFRGRGVLVFITGVLGYCYD